MKIVIYGHGHEREEFCSLLEIQASLAFRQSEYKFCEDYDDFIKTLSDGEYDLIIVAVDGAIGMEGVIASKNIRPDTAVIWFSDDKAFGAQSYRLGCSYFSVKPVTDEALSNAIHSTLK